MEEDGIGTSEAPLPQALRLYHDTEEIPRFQTFLHVSCETSTLPYPPMLVVSVALSSLRLSRLTSLYITLLPVATCDSLVVPHLPDSFLRGLCIPFVDAISHPSSDLKPLTPRFWNSMYGQEIPFFLRPLSPFWLFQKDTAPSAVHCKGGWFLSLIPGTTGPGTR